MRSGLEESFSWPTGGIVFPTRPPALSIASLLCSERIADPFTLTRFSVELGGELESQEPGLTPERMEAAMRSCDPPWFQMVVESLPRTASGVLSGDKDDDVELAIESVLSGLIESSPMALPPPPADAQGLDVDPGVRSKDI